MTRDESIALADHMRDVLTEKVPDRGRMFKTHDCEDVAHKLAEFCLEFKVKEWIDYLLEIAEERGKIK